MLARTTMEIWLDIFKNFGFPETLISDNGRTFISHEFESFLAENGILHKFSPPYHPSSNGQAKRFVQMIKSALKKCDNKANLHLDVKKIVMQYRNMPRGTTDKTPSELFLGQKIQSKLDSLKIVKPKICQNSLKNKFILNQRVQVRNYTKDSKWCFGKIIEIVGNCLYRIKLDNGEIVIKPNSCIEKCHSADKSIFRLLYT